MQTAMNKRISFFILTLHIFCLFNDSQGCNIWLGDRKRRKRTSAEEIQATEALREYFAACLNDKAVLTSDWESVVDYSVLETNWYRDTEDFTCLGNATAGCWKNELDVYVQSGNSSEDVLQAGKYCIDQYEADFSQGIFEYQPSKKKREVLPKSSNSAQQSSEVYNNLKEGYISCLDSSVETSSLPSFDYRFLSDVVDKHLQYSCDIQRTLSSTDRMSSVWPFRFAALTRIDSPLREALYRCGKDFFPPEPFWAGTGNWGVCSASCGGGTQTRERTCRDGADPRSLSDDCIGESLETRNCNVEPCAQG
ncbi:uncharacterized protein LOC143447197 [Clavelina lepadiformis]|uniref:uncharacterized protein LOC143446041 n=1 Tax=Clavelina lepadiformis TaxID=159417 RepID=UPI004041920E